MFELEKAIAEWRRELSRAGIRNPEVLDELESHLREQTALLVRSGMNAEQAFEAAIRRMGAANLLRSEFAKVKGTKSVKQSRWTMIFCLGFAILLWLFNGLLQMWIQLSPAQRALALAAFVLSAGFWCGMPWFHRFLPVIANRQKREWAQAACFVVWPLCGALAFRLMVSRLDLAIGQLFLTILWLMVPTGIFAGIAYGLSDAAKTVEEMPGEKELHA